MNNKLSLENYNANSRDFSGQSTNFFDCTEAKYSCKRVTHCFSCNSKIFRSDGLVDESVIQYQYLYTRLNVIHAPEQTARSLELAKPLPATKHQLQDAYCTSQRMWLFLINCAFLGEKIRREYTHNDTPKEGIPIGDESSRSSVQVVTAMPLIEQVANRWTRTVINHFMCRSLWKYK